MKTKRWSIGLEKKAFGLGVFLAETYTDVLFLCFKVRKLKYDRHEFDREAILAGQIKQVNKEIANVPTKQ